MHRYRQAPPTATATATRSHEPRVQAMQSQESDDEQGARREDADDDGGRVVERREESYDIAEGEEDAGLQEQGLEDGLCEGEKVLGLVGSFTRRERGRR